MGFFSRLKVGFGMARRSARVVRSHPKLLAFPLLGGVSGIAFLVTLFGSLYATGPLFADPGPVLYGSLFLAYLVETFVASFFTAALVAATRTAFRGEEPSVRRAIGAAWNRKGTLLIWAVIAAVVGVLIRAIEGEDNLIAQLAAAVFAVAWSVMTYFVVPVIVFRDPSPREMFRESGRTFKETWGESIGAMAAIDIVTVLLTLAGVALGAVTFFLTSALGTVGIVITVVVGGSAILLGLLVGKALTGVAKTALYVYATEDVAPEFFEDMDFGALGGDDASTTSSGMGGVLGGSGRGRI